MTKQEINLKRAKDIYYKNRSRYINTTKKLTRGGEKRLFRELCRHYDAKNRLMVEYEVF